MSSSVINHHIKVCFLGAVADVFYYCGCLLVTIITTYLEIIFRKRHLALGTITTLVMSHLIQPASAFTFSAQSGTRRLNCHICWPLFLPLYLASWCHSQPARPLARRRRLADTLFVAPSPLVALADNEVGCLVTTGRGEKGSGERLTVALRTWAGVDNVIGGCRVRKGTCNLKMFSARYGAKLGASIYISLKLSRSAAVKLVSSS